MESKFKRIEWKIPNCSKKSIKNYKVGDMIESETFKIRSGNVVTEWFLCFCPNGSDSKSFISLFLGLRDSNSEDFVITCKFGIKGKTEVDSRLREEFSLKGEEFIYGPRGYPDFLSWGEFFNPADRYIINGEITIVCEMSLKAFKSCFVESSPIPGNYKIFFEQGNFSDLRLKMSDGEVLKAHKVILASQSKIFLAMFINESKEVKEEVVEIPDIDSKSMKEALRFMYYGKIENLDKMALKLIFIAEKFELDELKKKCIDSLIKSLTTENVLQLLVISDKISKCEILYDSCIDLITRKYQIIKRSQEWAKLPKDLMMKTVDEVIYSSADTIYV